MYLQLYLNSCVCFFNFFSLSLPVPHSVLFTPSCLLALPLSLLLFHSLHSTPVLSIYFVHIFWVDQSDSNAARKQLEPQHATRTKTIALSRSLSKTLFSHVLSLSLSLQICEKNYCGSCQGLSMDFKRFQCKLTIIR